MAINQAFFVDLAAAVIRFGVRTAAALSAFADFVVLVMMFSILINRSQRGPGTEESPERRAEKMEHCKKVRPYRQYHSVQRASPVVSAARRTRTLNDLHLQQKMYYWFESDAASQSLPENSRHMSVAKIAALFASLADA